MDVIKTSEWDEFVQLKPELVNQMFVDWIEKFL
jgi:hypothetical protein